jgi:O-antigen ligase
MLASMLLSPFSVASRPVTEDYLKQVVFYVLLVTTVRTERDLRIIVTAYVCIVGVFMAHSLREFNFGRAFYKQGIMRLQGVGVTFSDQNFFAGLIVVSLPFAWLLWREWKVWWARIGVLGYIGLSVFCVIKSASRMGFVGLLVMGILVTLSSPKRWRFLAISPAVFLAIWTLLPEANQDRYLTILGVEDAHASPVIGYRTGGFWKGVDLCALRPVLGFGPNTTTLATGGLQAHNTYGQLIGELGIVGSISFGLIILGFAQNTLEVHRLANRLNTIDDLFARRTVVAVSIAMGMLLFLGWSLHFLYYYFWLWFGAFHTIAIAVLHKHIEDTQVEPASDMPFLHLQRVEVVR